MNQQMPPYAPQAQTPQAPYPPVQHPQQFAPPPPPPAAPKGRSAGAVIGAIAGVVTLLAGLAIGALFLFGTKTLDETQVEAEIVELTEQSAGVAPTGVECPDDIAVESGAVSSCTATLDGQPMTYSVTQTDAEGNVEIEGDATFVVLATVEASLVEQIGPEAGVEVVASCDAEGRSVIVDGAGAPIPCTVASVEDPTDYVDVVATVDDEGAVSFVEA